jgi:hypothetical protein
MRHVLPHLLAFVELFWLLGIQAVGAAERLRIAVPDIGGQFLMYPLAQKQDTKELFESKSNIVLG